MQLEKEFQKVSLQEIAPYIGRFSAQRAHELVIRYAKPGQTLLDPFCGSSVLPLEAAIHGCNVIASDINPYAILQTRAKLFAPPTLDIALKQLDEINNIQLDYSLKRKIPKWVKSFFHPKTLKEILAYTKILDKKKLDFHLACLMGILHHQRPGFLSFPSSHTTPYLRNKKFPKEEFPELYEYREVRTRLVKKINRTFKKPIHLNSELNHLVILSDIQQLEINDNVANICITSPPYMNNLSYGRDNRLRLWFLGVDDWNFYDKCGYNTLSSFNVLMNNFFERVNGILVKKGICVLVVGEARGLNILDIFKDSGKKNGFKIIQEYFEEIPNVRRSRKGYSGTISETVLVFKKV